MTTSAETYRAEFGFFSFLKFSTIPRPSFNSIVLGFYILHKRTSLLAMLAAPISLFIGAAFLSIIQQPQATIIMNADEAKQRAQRLFKESRSRWVQRIDSRT